MSAGVDRRPTPAAVDGTGGTAADEAAVRGLYRRSWTAWNQGSGAAFAAAFAEDGDLVAFDGTHFRGRREIAPFQQQLFDKWLKGSRLVGRVTDVRFLSPDVAVLHAVGGTVLRGKAAPAPERDSIQTLVATRRRASGASRRSRTPASAPSPAARPRSWCGRSRTGCGRCSA